MKPVRHAPPTALLVLLASVSASLGQVQGHPEALFGGWPSGSTPSTNAVVLVNADLSCSGVLVKPDIVLTAGHCLSHGMPPTDEGIADPAAGDWEQSDLWYPIFWRKPEICRPGNITVSFGEDSTNFELTVPARYYSIPGSSDIAAIKLDQRVPASIATPIDVLREHRPNSHWRRMWFLISGWGGTERDPSGEAMPTTQRQTGFATFSDYPCSGGPDLFCVRGWDAAPRAGDSGSPLLWFDVDDQRWLVVGINQGSNERQWNEGRYTATFAGAGGDRSGANVAPWLDQLLAGGNGYSPAGLPWCNLVNQSSGFALAASHRARSGDAAYLWRLDSKPSSRWRIEPVPGTSQVRILNQENGLAMIAPRQLSNGVEVTLARPANDRRELWDRITSANGFAQFQSAGSRFALAASLTYLASGPAYVWSANGHSDLEWRVLRLPDGTVELDNRTTGLRAGVGSLNRVVVRQAPSHPDLQWRIVPAGVRRAEGGDWIDLHEIVHRSTGLSLLPPREGRQVGAPPRLMPRRGQLQAQWRLADVSPERREIKLIPRGTRTAVGASGANNGGRVEMRQDGGGLEFVWKMMTAGSDQPGQF